eukprot:Rhum_TRINITY_DN14423_c14_g1::Rhum_TRINITY_DN14423_c14_g1_i1::g.89025::m.89025
MEADQNLTDDEGEFGNVLEANRLLKYSEFDKHGWFYVRLGGKQSQVLRKSGGWQPRWAEVKLPPDQPGSNRGVLRICRGEEDGLLHEFSLGGLTNTVKKVLEMSEAKNFPIARCSGAPSDDDGGEFRWGHLIFTLERADGMYAEFVCESTKVRDQWVEWFRDYLVLRETVEMQVPAAACKKPQALSAKSISKYIESFLHHQLSENLATQQVHPCCHLDPEEPPAKEVMWARMKDTDINTETCSRTSDLSKKHIKASTTCFQVFGLLPLKVKKLGESQAIPFANTVFRVHGQWSNKMMVEQTGTLESQRFVLAAKDVVERDKWLRWMQYVKVRPVIDQKLKGEWHLAHVLSNVKSESRGSRRKETEERRREATQYTCYVSKDFDRVAYKDFPQHVHWETTEDEMGRVVYKEHGSKLRARVIGGAGKENMGTLQFDYAYDIYEEYFQSKAETYPNAMTKQDEESILKTETTTAEETPKDPPKPAGWSALRAKTSLLLWASGRSATIKARTRFRQKIEQMEVDYEEDKKRCVHFLAPWDLADDVVVGFSVPEVEGEGLTLLEAKEKYGDEWNLMSAEEKRLVISSPQNRGTTSRTPAQVILEGLRQGKLSQAVDKMEASLNADATVTTHDATVTTEPAGVMLVDEAVAPAVAYASDAAEVIEQHGKVYTLCGRTGIQWEGAEEGSDVFVKAVVPGGQAHAQGVLPGMLLLEANARPVRGKDDLQQALLDARRNGFGRFRLVMPETSPPQNAVPYPNSPLLPEDAAAAAVAAGAPASPHVVPASPFADAFPPRENTGDMAAVTCEAVSPVAVPVAATLSPFGSRTFSCAPCTPAPASPVLPERRCYSDVAVLLGGAGTTRLPPSPANDAPSPQIASLLGTAGSPRSALLGASPTAAGGRAAKGPAVTSEQATWCYVREGGQRNKRRWCAGDASGGCIVVYRMDNDVAVASESVRVANATVRQASSGTELVVTTEARRQFEMTCLSREDCDGWMRWFASVPSVRRVQPLTPVGSGGAATGGERSGSNQPSRDPSSGGLSPLLSSPLLRDSPGTSPFAAANVLGARPKLASLLSPGNRLGFSSASSLLSGEGGDAVSLRSPSLTGCSVTSPLARQSTAGGTSSAGGAVGGILSGDWPLGGGLPSAGEPVKPLPLSKPYANVHLSPTAATLLNSPTQSLKGVGSLTGTLFHAIPPPTGVAWDK